MWCSASLFGSYVTSILFLCCQDSITVVITVLQSNTDPYFPAGGSNVGNIDLPMVSDCNLYISLHLALYCLFCVTDCLSLTWQLAVACNFLSCKGMVTFTKHLIRNSVFLNYICVFYCGPLLEYCIWRCGEQVFSCR